MKMVPIRRVLCSFQPLVSEVALANNRLCHSESVFAWEATVNFSVWLYHDLQWSRRYTSPEYPVIQ